jgi:hypothetical protein
MGREKTEFAERHQGELLPRRAREYVPPHAIPEQPDARTMENATIKLSPDLDPRMQMTVLAARYVQEDHGPWRGLFVGLTIGSALGALVWFGPWASWFGAGRAVPNPSALASASGAQVVDRAWDSLEPAEAQAAASARNAPSVVEEAGEIRIDFSEGQPEGASLAGGAGAPLGTARSAPPSSSTQAKSFRASRPATPRKRQDPEVHTDEASRSEDTSEPTPSGNRVWLAPKERKVWLE